MRTIGDAITSMITTNHERFSAERVAPLEGTRSLIRRRRMLRAGTASATSVIAIGAMALGGISLAQQDGLGGSPLAITAGTNRPLDDPALGPDPAYAAMSIHAPDPRSPYTRLACGDEAPVPTAAGEGFSMRSSVTAPDDGARATAYVTHDGAAATSAHVSGLGVVYTQDGMVVGWGREESVQGVHRSFDPGQTVQVRGDIAGWGTACASPGEGAAPLPEGDYEVYLVVDVAATPELAALRYARDLNPGSHSGIFPPALVLRPGSWDCQRAVEARYLELACLPDLVPHAQYDEATGTVRVPYPDDYLTREFATRLVSEPVAFTLTHDWDPNMQPSDTSGRWSDARDSTPSELQLACGANAPFFGDPAHYLKMTAPRRWNIGYTPGSPLPIDVIAFDEPETAIIDFDSSYVAYFLDSVNLSYETDPDNPDAPRSWSEVDATGREVVATARAVIGSGPPVPFDRYTGPAATTVTYTDISWCPGHDASTYVPAVLLEGTTTFDGTSGTWSSEVLTIDLPW